MNIQLESYMKVTKVIGSMMKSVIQVATIFFLVGCSIQSQTQSTQHPLTTVTPTSDSIPSMTPTATEKADLPTAISKLFFDCVSIKDIEYQSNNLQGTLVLSKSLLSLVTGEKKDLETNRYVSGLIVSPDQSKLALTLFDPNRVQIIDPTGNIVSEFASIDNKRLKPLYWLDDNSLVLRDYDSEDDPFPSPSIILNVQSGTWEVITPEFEDMNKNPDGISNEWFPYGYWTRLSINPDQTHWVYPAYSPANVTNELILWNAKSNEEVFRLPVWIESTFPWWSPDGTRFINGEYWQLHTLFPDMPYEGGSELVSVNTSGEIERLSYWTAQYKATPHSYVWSHNGEAIAFWLEIVDDDNPETGGPRKPHELAVLDVTTGETINYCLQGLDYPVWSPDNKYLAVRASSLDNPESDDIRDVFVIDLENKTAFEITGSEYDEIVGWMISPP